MHNKLNVLHLASFSGNIGDEANHIGFRSKFKKNIYDNVNFNNIEIRDFYKSWNFRKFDETFVSLANSHDLLVIGGGNFFEVCWDYSSSGTTIDIPIDLLNKINIPILFNGVGFDDGKGATEESILKFKYFISYLTSSPKIITSVRNDGSKQLLQKYYDKTITDKIYTVPDGGFFFKVDEIVQHRINLSRKLIGICVACDMPEIRFELHDESSKLDFEKSMANVVNNILMEYDEYDIAFLPHIYSDMEIISKIMNFVNDKFRRNRIIIGPYLNGTVNGAEFIFSLYKKCDLILGMRFHSNVCAIGNNIPTIGLISYHKHRLMYDELGLSDRYVLIKEKDFQHLLLDKFKQSIDDLSLIKKRYDDISKSLNVEIDKFHKGVYQWLASNSVI